jgi:3-hydroxyisobutyrate dehydrogenase-like beta-hydroxyacid dehydrogenase
MATTTSDLPADGSPPAPPSIAVIGLGEAGSAVAGDLVAAGCDVRGWDVDSGRRPPGVAMADGVAAAVRGADLVLSLVTAAAARDVAGAAAGELRAGAVFADLNTGGAELKRELAATVQASGALFADVAVMAPVPGRGLRTPLLVSGDGAARVVELLVPLGAQVEEIPGGPGAAAARKLIRSVFMKGLAAALLEAEAAARAAGCADWLRADVAGTLAAADEQLVARLIEGSRTHAARRVHELEDAAALLQELGVEPRIADAARRILEELA